MADQLSSESLQLLCIPQLRFPHPSTCRAADNPSLTISAASTSHLPISPIMQDSQAAYMPSPSELLMGLVNNNPTFSCNAAAQSSAAKSTNMALLRSNNLGNMPWPTESGSQHSGNSDAILFCNDSLSVHTIGLHTPHTTSGNPIEANSKAAQQSSVIQLGLNQSINSHTPVGAGAYELADKPHQGQGQSAGVKQGLMIEAAKQQDGFNPKHTTDNVHWMQQMPVQRASNNPSFFSPMPATNAHTQAMQENLGRGIPWRSEGIDGNSEGFWQQPQCSSEPSSVQLHSSRQDAATCHLQISELECGAPVLDIPTKGFQQVPSQHVIEHMSGHCYSMH